MNKLSFVLLAGWLSVISGDPLRAEVFLLTTGGQVEGQLQNADQRPRENYQIKTLLGVTITLDKSQVQRVVPQSDAERQYQELLPRVPNTAAGQWEMAEWCHGKGLTRQREYHLEQVIALDPDHSGARYGLGYGKVNGRWLRTDEYMRSQGYVWVLGGWRLQQEVAVETRERELESAQKDWKVKLKRWRGGLARRRTTDTIADIKAIRDPLAAAAFADLLEEEQQRALKLLYIDVLGQLRTTTATLALIKCGLNDVDESVRDRCLDQLANYGTHDAVSAFLRALDSDDNGLINRAAVGLARMNDPDAISPLIDALTSKHKMVLSAGGGGGGLGPIGVGFGSNGPGGLSVGGRPRIIEQEVRNHGALDALIALSSGENYLFDKEAWKRWYVDSHTPHDVNLRRRDD